jgi:hypothetical protein
VSYRADLWNLWKSFKLKLPHLMKEELTKQLLLKDGSKKNTIQPPGKTRTELLLKCQHQDWMMKE